MRRGLGRATVLAGIIAVAALGGVAHGQVPETPDLPEAPEVPAVPEPPEQAQPVVEAAAPSTAVVCQVLAFGPASVSSATSLATLALSIARLPAVAPPDELYSYLGLTYLPCAAIPLPRTISECSTDRTADDLGDQVFAATGAGLVVVFVPVPVPRTGSAVDTAVEAEELLVEQGVDVPGTPASSAYEELECVDVLEGVGAVPEDPATDTPTATPTPLPEPPVDDVVFSEEGARVSAPAPLPAPAPERTGPTPPPSAVQPVADPMPSDSVVAAPVAATTGDGDPWSPWRIGGIASGVVGLVLLWLFIDAGRRGAARSVTPQRVR